VAYKEQVNHPIFGVLCYIHTALTLGIMSSMLYSTATMHHYKNTADYITRVLLGKPEGYPVWLRFEDCQLINRMLADAATSSNDPAIHKLYARFNTQYKERT
jgi:hypothetical protein